MSLIFTLAENSLTLFVGMRPHTITRSHHNWDRLMRIVKGEEALPDDAELTRLLDVRQVIQSNDRIEIVGDELTVDGRVLNTYLTRRIVGMSQQGIDPKPWISFLDKLMQNPSKQVYDDLYTWLEASNMPINSDGRFWAYKKVDENLQSYHASPDGTHLQHQLGKYLSMPRREVDDRRENTCSTGLHFCGWDYLRSYYGHSGKVIALLIDPADVVSIPTDYNFQKGRACGYTPVYVLADEDVKHVFDGEGPLEGYYVYDYEYDHEGDDESED